jgi:hypothetical protein
MGSKLLVRFTIDAEGSPRTLFGITEQTTATGHGDLKLHLKSPWEDNILDENKMYTSKGPNPERRVLNQYYSIHPSTESPNRINVLKQTRILANREYLERAQYTQAIKGGNSFAYMFCRRCPTMTQQPFVSRRSAKDNVSLGAYDPKLSTLIYAVMAGAANTVFAPDRNPLFDPINVYQRKFKSVRIIVLWTFFCVPASGSLTEHISTQQPDPHAPQFLTGETATDCMNQFIETSVLLANAQMEYFRLNTSTTESESRRR